MGKYASKDGSGTIVAWGDITGKPATFAPIVHDNTYHSPAYAPIASPTFTGIVNTDKLIFRSQFSSYVIDGIWGATAVPSYWTTPGNGKGFFGYHDGGSGQYSASLGFQNDSVAPDDSLKNIRIRRNAQSYDKFYIAANGSIYWGVGTSDVDTNLYRSGANQLQTDDTFIVSTYLGIGGAPSYKLDIKSAVGAHSSECLARLDVIGDDIYSTAGGYLGFSVKDHSNGDIGQTDAVRIQCTRVSDAGGSRLGGASLSFWTNPGAAGETDALERVTILNNGDVGFGTNTPSEKVHIVGNQIITGSLMVYSA